MKRWPFLFVVVSYLGVGLVGCSGSGEMQRPGAAEILQRQIAGLKVENDSLKRTITKLEQDVRAANARSSALEAQVNELKLAKPATQPTTKIKITDPRDSYLHALELFRKREYKESASILQAILDADPPERLDDNVHYWLGECAYGMQEYDDAIGHFQKVFGYSRSEKKDESQIMIANSYFSMGNRAKAKEEYERLVEKFPASPFVPMAKAKLAGL